MRCKVHLTWFVLWLAAVTTAAAVVPGAARAQACGGVQLPATLEAFGSKLVRNGIGLREATFLKVDVYVAGLYLGRRTRNVQTVLDQKQAKAMMLRFVRDVSRDDMVDAIYEALKNNVGSSFSMAKEHMARFVSRLPEFKTGTELIIAYKPGSGVELRANGKSLGVDPDETFGNLLFRAWLGNHPPDADLKDGLLGGACD